MYDSSDDVVILNEGNFQKEVVQSDSVWLVEFYAPWCGHCQSLAPAWKKAAKALKGVVKVGAVDADSQRSLGGQYGVQGFPTIKIFGADKTKPQDYRSDRSANAIVQAGLKAAQDVVNARLSGKSGGSKSSGGSGGGSGGGTDDVVTLTDSNFESLVINSNEPWLVEFFAPWCGHCKNLAPEYAKAATELRGKVKLGALDATAHQSTAQRYQVQGYPTLKFFPAGPKSWDSAEDYDGGRVSADIVQWCLNKWTATLPPPEVHQLTEQSFLDKCAETQLCVISFLPHILDSGAEGRFKYIDILKESADKFKQRNFGWIWSEAGATGNIEESVGVGGFGYPAMVALNARKKFYTTLTGPFSESGVHEFLRDLVGGRGRTQPLKGGKLPDVSKVEPWDGKDGVLPEVEDIDLSDFDMDEDSSKTEL
jgi:protein disulfide-isomerase A6